MSAGNGVYRHQVVVPKHLRDRLLAWGTEAAGIGRLPEYLDALRLLETNLQSNPQNWGDSLWNYRAINAKEHMAVVAGWLIVWYGLDETTRVVAVRDIRPAPGSPLTDRA